ncbi:MAG TPA: hypothetical protein VFK73_05450 [Paludibacter sp.]|nr:hypothetical protein [Paludibacter sp.]
MKRTIFTILILTQVALNAQNMKPSDSFSVLKMEVKGDLNKDNIEDKVVVTQDTINEKSPYKIQIYFGEADGKLNLIVASTKLIEAQYPDGRDGFKTGNEFADVTIKNGIISVNSELLRGHFEYKFRFQNGNFELIGFSEVASDGQGVMSTTDFNLSTGMRIVISERYDTNEVISNTKKKILIRPLPKFQDVAPFENELY